MSEHFSVGEKVAVLSGGSYHRIASIATIDRETKLYWIAGNTKFRKQDGRKPGGDAWSMMAQLAKMDDPRVAELFAEQKRRDSFSRLLGAVDQLRSDRENIAAIQAVIDRSSDYLKLID